MKLTKMSLVAALLIGSSAFAIENTKVSGNAQMFYNTTDDGENLFDKETSAADLGLNLNLTSDLVKTDSVAVSAGAGLTAIATLGLENNLVNAAWGGAHTVTTPNGSAFDTKVNNAMWMNEAWIAATAGKTTLKLGRMELDTPLAFTEMWTIEKNTFEGIVVLNEDIPSTTLIGAYIGNGNGTEDFGVSTGAGGAAYAGVVNADGTFDTYGTDGAYLIGATNNSWEPLTVQAWYYNLTRVAETYWLQADLSLAGVMAGAQYSSISIDKAYDATEPDSDVYALMLGYEMTDVFTAKVSYSQVGKDYRAGFNTATDSSTAQSKLYTEAWWMYGSVTQKDTESYNITIESPVNGIVDLGLYYTNADQSVDAGNGDVEDLTLTASKSFGPLDTSLAYSYIDTEGNDAYNQIQVYLTLNF